MATFRGGRLDRLAGWLGREFHRLFRERIYAATGFSSRLVHDRNFGEARNDELAGFIQFFIAYSRHLLDEGLHVMKARMGATHFLTKTLPKVAAEMALS